MRSFTADEIATLLNRLGLPSSKFDTEEIAKDLKERRRMRLFLRS